MQIKCHCDFCGLSFHNSNLLQVEGYAENITISGGSVQCPRCGRKARVLDGTYSFIGDSAAALRGASYEQLQQLREVARAASEGVIDAQKAKAEAEGIIKGSGNIAEFAIRWQVLPLLLGFIALYMQWVAMQSSNTPSPELMSALAKIDSHMEQLYQEETTSRNTIPGFQTNSVRAPPSIHTPPPSRTPSGPNRAQRRRNAALARKPVP